MTVAWLGNLDHLKHWGMAATAAPALGEPMATALLLAVLGLLAAIAVLSSRTADRLGVPAVLILLVLGMVAGRQGLGGISFTDYHFAFRVGTLALILILFEGGFSTSLAQVQSVLLPASILATLGVALTAALVAVAAHLLGLTWTKSLLIGAVVSSTDTAAVFSVLRAGSLRLNTKIGRTIEVESCLNDPMAVILTTILIEALSLHRPPAWMMLLQVPVQLVLGAGIGILIGLAGRFILRRMPLTTSALIPAFTVALALVSFGIATLAQGSGFLAVYLTGVFLDASSLPYRSALIRVHAALAWLGQIGMFLMLGLLVFPSQLWQVAWTGLAVALVLALIARPVAVALCLFPLRYSAKETAFIGWVGLRGAVPIILATFPVMAHLPGARHIFNIVFFVVVINTLVPGATIRRVTRWFKLGSEEKPAPDAVLEINSPRALAGDLASFLIEPSVAVCGATLREIEFPPAAAVMLIVRGEEFIAARGDTRLAPGDHVYIFFNRRDRGLIDLLFGRAEVGGTT
jgi:cell volume regulation protein A